MPNDNIYLSIIITAFNESKIIIPNVDEIASWIDTNLKKTFEIIVVDDGSIDNMHELLIQAQKSRAWLTIVNHPTNLGRGAGIRSGFKIAKGKYFISLDADLSYDPEHIRKLLEPLENNTADITLASPYHTDGEVINVPKQRAVISKIGNKILSRGFNKKFSTVTCIVRGFKKEAIKKLELINNGKELHLEILQKANLLGLKIVEVPATLHWRDIKRGKAKNKKILPEFSLFKMRKTVLSHLIFNYITNPGIILLIPLLILASTIIIGSSFMLYALINNFIYTDASYYEILRKTLLDGQLSLALTFFASIVLMIIVIFYFLSLQIKHYFEDIYILLSKISYKVNELEKSEK